MQLCYLKFQMMKGLNFKERKMRYKLKVYSIWEFGKRKDAEGNPHQEDCTFPLPNDLKASDRTFILCDGMGGHDAGEVASSTVCQAMGKYILNSDHDTDRGFTDEDLKHAIAVAFDALDKEDSGAEKKMGTTLAFLKLHNSGATIAHIGDSRVYHIRPGKDGADTKILFETEDHSLVNDLIKIGELTKEEALQSNQKHVITRAMQPNMERKPKADVYHTSNIKDGDYFYICSDGMLEQPDMENGESLRNIFSDKIDSVERKVEILRDVTEDNRDNHTALIIHIEKVEGCIPQIFEELNTSVPSKKIGIVEESEGAEEMEASHTNSVLDTDEETNDESSEANTPSKSSPDKEMEKTNGEKESKNSNSLSYAIGTTNEDESIIKNSKSTRKTYKLIANFVIAVIIAAACVLGIKYTSNHFHKRGVADIESLQKKNKREEGQRIERKRRQMPNQAQFQMPASKPLEVVAIDAANSDAAPTAMENGTPTKSDSSSSTTVISVPFPNPADGFVDSDEQKIINNTHNKKND